MTTTAPDLLVLAAHPLEFTCLLSRLSDPPRGRLFGLGVSCHSVGVGAIEAAAGTERILASERPRGVLLLGSYGYFPTISGNIGDLTLVSEAILIDVQVLAGKAAYPGPMPQRVAFDQALTAGLAGLDNLLLPAAMATTLAITEGDDVAAELGRRTGCRGENLEAFAVGRRAEVSGVPCAALLGATNRVGSEGRQQWREHHAAVAEATVDFLCRWLAAGAPGLPPG